MKTREVHILVAILVAAVAGAAPRTSTCALEDFEGRRLDREMLALLQRFSRPKPTSAPMQLQETNTVVHPNGKDK